MNTNKLSNSGWEIHHQEQLKYQVSSGSPSIRVKFYHYPPYRQYVDILEFPASCKRKIKEPNEYFIFQGNIRSKGILNLERKVRIKPILTVIDPQTTWGNASDISPSFQQKYKTSSHFWPLGADTILDVQEENWFKTENLNHWIKKANEFINTRIKFRENQKERFGAVKALLLGYGDCDEFADVLITLARVRGIPARRLTGYFIRENGKKVEPHAWSEIFSPKMGWIIVDLALGNIGQHTSHYIISKVEEFNPDLPDYRVQTKQTGVVHYEWIRPDPLVTISKE